MYERIRKMKKKPDSKKTKMDGMQGWLLEWNLASTLRQADLCDGEDENEEYRLIERETASELVRPFDHSVASGQIRLLSPGLTPEHDRPVYVALIQESDLGLLAIPYGPFSMPALHSEMKSDRSESFLSVYQIWNARNIPGELIRKSWLIDQIGKKELENVISASDFVSGGNPLPSSLLRRIGPPASEFSDTDPRKDYVREERSLFAVLDEKIVFLEGLENGKGRLGSIPFPADPDVMPRAAASRPGQGGSPAILLADKPLSTYLAGGKWDSTARSLLKFAAKSLEFQKITPKTEDVLLMWDIPDDTPMFGVSDVLMVDNSTRTNPVVIGTGIVMDDNGKPAIIVNRLIRDAIQSEIVDPGKVLLLLGAI
jgi:hypothetical protein